ncbi:unnamed protein product, partial [Effrenium voratum]
MASNSRSTAAAAGVAALLGGAAFVAPSTSSGQLRAAKTASSASTAAPVSGRMEASTMAVAGAALAVCLGRKGTASAKHLVALKAFESELGVQAPVGFWDPVGFTSDGDVATFKRRRSVELKHGRISMMAAMG